MRYQIICYKGELGLAIGNIAKPKDLLHIRDSEIQTTLPNEEGSMLVFNKKDICEIIDFINNSIFPKCPFLLYNAYGFEEEESLDNIKLIRSGNVNKILNL